VNPIRAVMAWISNPRGKMEPQDQKNEAPANGAATPTELEAEKTVTKLEELVGEVKQLAGEVPRRKSYDFEGEMAAREKRETDRFELYRRDVESNIETRKIDLERQAEHVTTYKAEVVKVQAHREVLERLVGEQVKQWTRIADGVEKIHGFLRTQARQSFKAKAKKK
jgi:hypothetical protein